MSVCTRSGLYIHGNPRVHHEPPAGGPGPLPLACTHPLVCPRQPWVASTVRTPIRGSEGPHEPGPRLSLVLVRLTEGPPLCSFRGGGLVGVINRKSSRKPSLQ